MKTVAFALTFMLGVSPALGMNLENEAASTNVVVNECLIKNEEQFRIDVAPLEPIIMMATDHARVTILNYINGERAKNKIFPFEADRLMVGMFVVDGVIYVGIAMFKDDCLVPGTAGTYTMEAFVDLLDKTGLSVDDFIKE